MKKVIIVLLAMVILNSCKKESGFDSKDFPQKWELVSTRGDTGVTRTGNDMAWKETYYLYGNSTFVKIRITNGLTQTASGTFTIKRIENERYLIFEYPTYNQLIGSCTSNQLEEALIIQSNSSIYNNTWQVCDGPGLGYKRVE